MKEHLSRLFWKIAQKRGYEKEIVVDLALLKLMGEDKVDAFSKSKILDKEGVDRMVEIGSKRYKLQVKSSPSGVQKALEKHPERYRHNDIIFIVPKDGESIDSVASKIMRLIEEFEKRMHKS